MTMQVSKKFLETSERIANHFQTPTRVTIDEEGLHVEIGGRDWTDLTRVKNLELGDHVQQAPPQGPAVAPGDNHELLK